MDSTTAATTGLQDEQPDPVAAVAAAVTGPLTAEEEQDLAAMQRGIADPQVARRVLDAARAVAFVDEEDLAPALAVDYQVRAFGELHGREHGGTWEPGQPIDLDATGPRVSYTNQPLAALAAVGGGRARRLRNGLWSLPNTSDSTLGFCAVETGGHLQITAWTTAGQCPYRRWWLRATLDTGVLAPTTAREITFAVAAEEPAPGHGPAGPPVVFTDRSGSLLGAQVADWLTSRRNDDGTFHTPIQVVGPADVPDQSDIVAPR